MIYVVNIILLNGDRVLTSDVETPKNILFILIDDLRHLSDKKVYLPNINFLGKTGATFKNAFAQVSISFILFRFISIKNKWIIKINLNTKLLFLLLFVLRKKRFS